MSDFLRTVEVPVNPPQDEQTTEKPMAGRTVSRMRPRRPVPTDRMNFEKAKDALAAFAAASRGGLQPVGAADLAVRLEVIEATARLNNAFFAEAGWIEKTGKGRYMPTDPVIKYAQQRGFNETEAATLLAPAIRESWYFQEIEPELRIGRPVPISQLVAILGRAANADADYRPQLESILRWLEYVGLILIFDGQVQLGQRDIQDLQRRGADGADEKNEEPLAGPAGSESTGATTVEPPQGGKRPAPVLTLNFDLSLTADDLKGLDAEQIRSIFEAVGKVAAVKAELQ